MTLVYTTVKEFWQFAGLNNSTQDYQPGQTPTRETVQATPVTAGVYYLAQRAVNPDTLVLYVGDTATTLALDTDYTFNSDTSAVTITSDGATALTGEALKAHYDYCQDSGLTYNESVSLLERMERRLHKKTNTVFADQTATNPTYLKIVDELHPGKSVGSFYQTNLFPLAKLQTTVTGAYTTGGTEITLTSATGFPNSGTIYIDRNKVSYTSKSSNTLTVPSNTPSISDGAVVRGEVIEVSTSPNGVDPVYQVLIPGSDYAIDYDTGDLQIFDSYYNNEYEGLNFPQDGIKDRVRLSYHQAYHDLGQDCELPEDIEELVYMMAGRQGVQRTIIKSHIGQRDNFDPQNIGFSKKDIDEWIRDYRVVRNSNI